MTTVQYLIRFLADFFSLVPMYTFLIGCYFLWRQTYRISLGHYWFGQIAMITLLVLDVLFTFYRKEGYGSAFRPVVNLALTGWVFYNGWFFKRYPIPWKYLQATVSPVRTEPLYVPRTWLGSRLIRTPDTKPFWFSEGFKWVAVVGLFVIISGYFMQKLVTLAVISDQRVVEAQKAVDQKFSTAAKEVTKEVTKAVASAVDTLQKGQDKANESASVAMKKADALEQKVDVGIKSANRRSYQADAKADRALNSPVIPVVPLYPKGPTGEIPTSRVQPPTPTPTRIRGRKVGLVDQVYDLDEVAQYRDN